MKIYHSYHNTGGSHQVEFGLTPKGWFYRFRWAPDEWLPLKKLKATEDGTGDTWTTYEGTCDGKPYTVTMRLVPVLKSTKWEGCESYPPLAEQRLLPVRTDSTDKEVSAPGREKHEGGAFSLSDLLAHDSTEELSKTDVLGVSKSVPKTRGRKVSR